MEGIVERADLETWTFESGWLPRLRHLLRRGFGCWHKKLSLPFTRGDETYQTCISCGARRRFDLDQWNSTGGLYYPKKHTSLYGRRLKEVAND